MEYPSLKALFILVLLALAEVKAQEALDKLVTKAKSEELGKVVLLLMLDRQQNSIPWDHRAESAIRWIDNGYVTERRSNRPDIAVRRGLIRTNVLGIPATVLRQRRQELWWTVRYVTVGPAKFGVEEMWIAPGTPWEVCFGSLYEGCEFEVLPSLKAAGIISEELCRYSKGTEMLRGYILRHPQRNQTQLQVMISGGSGGFSTDLMLRASGDPKELCTPKLAN